MDREVQSCTSPRFRLWIIALLLIVLVSVNTGRPTLEVVAEAPPPVEQVLPETGEGAAEPETPGV